MERHLGSIWAITGDQKKKVTNLRFSMTQKKSHFRFSFLQFLSIFILVFVNLFNFILWLVWKNWVKLITPSQEQTRSTKLMSYIGLLSWSLLSSFMVSMIANKTSVHLCSHALPNVMDPSCFVITMWLYYVLLWLI